MSDERIHQIQITGSSLKQVKELLATSEQLDAGVDVTLGEGLRLGITDVTKSSGFDVASVLVTGLVTVVTSTSSALLIEWLKSRLLESTAGTGAKSHITITIDGKEITISH
jgi:hypothetical protein